MNRNQRSQCTLKPLQQRVIRLQMLTVQISKTLDKESDDTVTEIGGQTNVKCEFSIKKIELEVTTEHPDKSIWKLKILCLG